jgi:hypothetical protein
MQLVIIVAASLNIVFHPTLSITVILDILFVTTLSEERRKERKGQKKGRGESMKKDVQKELLEQNTASANGDISVV